MSNILQRSIAHIQHGTAPQPVKEYILGILEKRKSSRRPPAKTGFKAMMMPVPKLKKELDRVFSIFIRATHADENGMVACVTCGHWSHWKEKDNGHYQLRQYLNTRWDEKNCAPQCGGCNGPRAGEPEKFAIYIDRKYGAGTAELLRAKARLPLKLDRHKLQMRINYYKKLIGETV